MKCDISTCSAAHISLLVSGSAQTCFGDQVIERSLLIQAVPSLEENKSPSSKPRTSVSIACGATFFEVCLKAPSWALQEKDQHPLDNNLIAPPNWLRRPPPSRKIYETGQGSSPCSHSSLLSENLVATRAELEDKETRYFDGAYSPVVPIRQKLKVAAMRPIPQTNIWKMMPFSEIVQAYNYDTGQVKAILPSAPPIKHSVLVSNPAPNRRSSNVFQAKHIMVVVDNLSSCALRIS